jgi:uncharacterized DUF497 family protein
LQCKSEGRFENTQDIVRHRARLADEVEQVFANDPMLAEEHEQGGEERLVCFGITNRGRFLTVVYIERRHRIRVVTAYRMSRAQQRAYLTGDADA